MKKTVLRKFFIWEYDKEEKWLNEMSAQGWQLVNAVLFRYQFEKSEPNEYVYRLELLNESPDSNTSKAYLKFLNDSNIESVGKCRNWIYIRRKKRKEISTAKEVFITTSQELSE